VAEVVRSTDSYPQVLPQGIQTEVAGRAGIGDWQLRAVEVSVSNQALVRFGGGWPWGERPAEAKHPLPTAAGELQVDPATLLENIELMRQIDEQLTQSEERLEQN
jgi:hypothetical protein